MIKKIFKITALFLSTVFVAAAAGLIALNYFLTPMIEKKVRQIAADSFGARAEILQVKIKLPEAVVFVRGFKIADSGLAKYSYSVSVHEATLHIGLISAFLQKRLIFNDARIEGAILILEKKALPPASDPLLPETPRDSASPSQEKHRTCPEINRQEGGSFPHHELYIRKMKMENLKFIFRDYAMACPPAAPAVVEITNINSEIDNFLLSFRQTGNFKGAIHFNGYFDPARKGRLKAGGTIAKRGNEIDFDLKSEIQDADLTYFSQYYANTSLTMLKEARVDIKSDAKCQKNELKTYHDVRIYGIKLNDITPAPQDTLFGLPAATVINFFNDYGGEVKFSFNIGGTLSDPKFEPGPAIKEVISKALGDRIAAYLRELPRDVVKMSEKAIKGDIDFGKESQVWIKGIQKQFEVFKEGLKKK